MPNGSFGGLPAHSRLDLRLGQRRQRKRPEDRTVDAGARGADALPLMQRSPPEDGIMDDRQVDRPDETEQSRKPPFPAPLLLRSRKSDVAEVEEEQDQHRGQAAVPFPPRAPRRTAPNRAGKQTNGGE